jgi:signal transduction histidine kinase
MRYASLTASVGDASGEGISELLRDIFQGAWYMPHGHCYLWKPGLVWLHVLSDLSIGLAYFLISSLLYVLVKRIRLPFSPMIVAFGVFIGACGLTHFVEVWNVWNSAYWLAGWIKALTAFASVLTAVYLVRLRPAIVQVAETARLSEERRVTLEAKNRELESLYSRVREMDELKTRFFANVSHELRTPLTLILGPVERLLSQGASLVDGRRDLEVVQRNARLLLRHVNALLDTAKIEAGKMTLAYSRVDLAKLVRLCASNFDSASPERRITLLAEGPTSMPCEVDLEKIERVVLNLLSNAFKFTPNGGRIRCAWETQDGRARLIMEDSGPGVPAHLREAIFERFRRADGGDSRPPGGTGLGLAIAWDFVTLHEGTLRVDESPLGGARFIVELPLAAPKGVTVLEPPAFVQETMSAEAHATADMLRVQQPEPPTPPAQEAGKAGEADSRARVLIVEDTAEMRVFITRALAEEFQVHTAQDGLEGLQKAEALRPDIIVTDIMMPRLSGDALVRQVRARPELSSTPILLLSALADDDLRIALLGGGAQDYLVKPFREAELKARVRNLAAMKRTRDVLEQAVAMRSSDLETLARELAARQRQTQAALESLGLARAAGMAEVASNVLHNVGNVLTSAIINMGLLVEAAAASRMGQVSQISTLLEEHRASLADFLTHHPRGSLLPQYISALGEELLHEQAKLKDKLGTVSQHLDQIRAIIQVQQKYARYSLLMEECDLSQVLEDALRLQLPELERQGISLSRDMSPLPALQMDKHKVLHILIHLISNAMSAMEELPPEQRHLRVRLSAEGTRARLQVVDTGTGIAPEIRKNLFRQGFTTRKEGHGLGLHLSALAAQALGGRLLLESDGPGKGATATLELPLP